MLLLLAAGGLANQARAQVLENPAERPVTVSASVPDNQAPTTPILIAPENNSLLTVSRPTFIWRRSTDAQAMSHYQMTLNGSVLFNSIPLSATTNSSFTLTYDSSTGYYSLTPNENIADGTHSWKITAFDHVNNSTDSVTWSFTIDTTAPAFIITKIGEVSTSISAQDTDTFPASPILLTQNEPLITGTGERNSTVQATIKTPTSSQTAVFTINSSGNWQLQLGVLPRGVILYLDFVIVDPAGNVSVLLDVPFMIEAVTVVVPPEIPPILPPGIPPIEIPSLSPTEWQHKILERFIPFLPSSLKESAQIELIKPLPDKLPKYGGFGPVGALLLLLIPPAAMVSLQSGSFGWQFSAAALSQILAVLGYIPRKKRIGLVFDSSSQAGIAFAKVLFIGETPEGKKQHHVFLTDWDGYFYEHKLPDGKYQVTVSAPGYSLTSKLKKEPYVPAVNFYQGQLLEVTSDPETISLLIPLDPAPGSPEEEHPREYRHSWQILGMEALRFLRPGSLFFFVLALGLTLFFPTPINLLAVALYILAAIFLHFYRRRTQLLGLVADTTGEPLENAIFRFLMPGTAKTMAVFQSDRYGLFKLPVKQGKILAEVVYYGKKTGRDRNRIELGIAADEQVAVVLS